DAARRRLRGCECHSQLPCPPPRPTVSGTLLGSAEPGAAPRESFGLPPASCPKQLGYTEVASPPFIELAGMVPRILLKRFAPLDKSGGVSVGRKLYVGNLPFSATEADLHAKFATCGTVESAK